MGLAVAHALAKASKLQLLIIDRYGLGNEYCASNDFGRIFCYANGAKRRHTQMAIESLKLWRSSNKSQERSSSFPPGSSHWTERARGEPSLSRRATRPSTDSVSR